jgi:carboxymethylenebutenolidase
MPTESTSGHGPLIDAIGAHPKIAGAVFYGSYLGGEFPVPVLAHLPPDNTSAARDGRKGDQVLRVHTYPAAAGPFFAVPAHADYRASAAGVAHSRSLSFLKPLMGGPYFDLEAIWEEHTRYEFAERSVEETMATMVEEPYVNHVPTLTGGVGRAELTAFYRNHFIFSNPDDAAIELVSRTVGIDRVVDEFLFNCTHDRVIDWLYGLTVFKLVTDDDDLKKTRLTTVRTVQDPGRAPDVQAAEHTIYEHRQHPR